MRRRRPPAREERPPRPLPHQITIGQMYVQFQIPAKKYAGGWPVIMVHGSSHTGACLESTPDGREGWYPYFVRKGVPSYIVDQAGRGRSGFDESVIHEGEANIVAGDVSGGTALIPGFGRITDDGAWTNWFGHLVPANSTILTGTLIRHGDPRRSQSQPGRLQARGTAVPAREPWTPASRRGPEPSDRRPPGRAATTPSSTTSSWCRTPRSRSRARPAPPASRSNIAPANTWTPHNLAALVERLGGAIVVTHSQSGIMGHHMTRILKERGHLDLLKGLVTLEGSCSLPNSGLTAADFDNIPYMALKGDYTATSMVCSDTVNAINARRAAKQGTAKADYLKLDDMGILGVTHMMMLDKKNLEIADVIYGWLDKNVRSAGKTPVTRTARR